MTDHLQSLYVRFRQAGYSAGCALRAARVLRTWERAESNGLVRLRCEVDSEVHDGPEDFACDCGDPRCPSGIERIADTLATYGAYGVIGEFTIDGDEPDWTHADSVWGHVGYRDVLDPFENPYIVDVMAETLATLAREWSASLRPCLSGGLA